MLMLLLACGPDEELVAERDGLLDEVATQDERIATLEAENGVLAARADRLAVEVDSLRTQLAIERLGTDPIPVRFETNQGTIRCTLLPAEAPQTVLNFVDLAQGRREWVDPDTGRPTSRRFYDGLTFHRVMPGFMIQGGDPLGTGMGGPGYKFKDEITDRTFEKPGMLAMANSGPDTNGSQFFITEGTPVKLNGKHTIFGTCKDADVVKAIARVPTDSQNKPTSPVVIQKVVF